MRFLAYLNEAYAIMNKEGSPVYKNPTADDYNEMLKNYKEIHVRGILDMKDKNLFVADGFYFTHNLLHRTIRKLVRPSAKTIELEGHIKNNKIHLQSGDFYYRMPSAGDIYERQKWTREDFEWCLKYFDNPDEILKYFNVSNKVKVEW